MEDVLPLFKPHCSFSYPCVGADDVFVFVDAWKQSFSLLPYHTPLDRRLSWVIRRAGGAMLVTTLTTASSFYNVISPIPALKGFGLFTGMVVMADYFLMLLFYPTYCSIAPLILQCRCGKEPTQAQEKSLLHKWCPWLSSTLPRRE